MSLYRPVDETLSRAVDNSGGQCRQWLDRMIVIVCGADVIVGGAHPGVEVRDGMN